MRRPFNLEEYNAHPEWKIETRDGRPVRILCTDRKAERSIVALVDELIAMYYFPSGRGNEVLDPDCEDDLFFVTE